MTDRRHKPTDDEIDELAAELEAEHRRGLAGFRELDRTGGIEGAFALAPPAERDAWRRVARWVHETDGGRRALPGADERIARGW